MENLIGVECWADYYFFGKLFKNKHLIRKETNKAEVVKSLIERNRDRFSIGICDKDNEDIEGYIKQENVEYKICFKESIEVIKISNSALFIIQLCPKDFEKWIVNFVEQSCKKQLIEFGYDNQKQLDKDSKVLLPRIRNNEKLNVLFNFVLTEYSKTNNCINQLKKIVDYLLEKKYSVDVKELKNV